MHIGVAGQTVDTGQQQFTCAGLAQRSDAGKVAGVGTVAVLLEDQHRVIDDGPLQAAGVATGGATVERSAAAVGVGATEQQVAAAVFHQAASAGDRT
ncbi:hypothetical protein D3C73_1039670 [compost metagenome]